MDVKDEISFYQAVKARLVKFDSTGIGKTDEEIETAIRQVIDKALVTERVIDVFDAAGIKNRIFPYCQKISLQKSGIWNTKT